MLQAIAERRALTGNPTSAHRSLFLPIHQLVTMHTRSKRPRVSEESDVNGVLKALVEDRLNPQSPWSTEGVEDGWGDAPLELAASIEEAAAARRAAAAAAAVVERVIRTGLSEDVSRAPAGRADAGLGLGLRMGTAPNAGSTSFSSCSSWSESEAVRFAAGVLRG